MRIVCLSDTHSLHQAVQVPDGDLLIHAGDHCNHGKVRTLRDALLVADTTRRRICSNKFYESGEVKRFDRWLGTLTHQQKLIIAGNHDWPWQKRPHYAKLWLHHAQYLRDGGTEVGGFKVWGSPWQLETYTPGRSIYPATVPNWPTSGKKFLMIRKS